MTNTGLDKDFIAQQKERLLDLKEELLGIQRGMEEDEQERSQEEQDTELDAGDEAQQMFTREVDATIGEQVGQRLEHVDRALEKIEEDTYGLSDESGDEIPKGRLEAMPEAVRTVDEQQSFERERRPPV